MVRPLLFFCSLFKNLTPQVAGDITDMEPPAIAFPDELGEADLSCLLHLLDELEQAAVVGPVSGDDIGSTAEEMVTVLGSAHEGVELLAAVAEDTTMGSPHASRMGSRSWSTSTCNRW